MRFMFVWHSDMVNIVIAGAAVLLVAMKAYMKFYSDLSNVVAENHNIKRLLFDARGNTKKFFIEKREFPRVDTLGKVTAKVIVGERVRYMKAVNISLGGALLLAPSMLKLGEILDVSLDLPLYTEPITVKAQVVSVVNTDDVNKGNLIGTKFIAMEGICKDRLVETIDIISGKRSGKPC